MAPSPEPSDAVTMPSTSSQSRGRSANALSVMRSSAEHVRRTKPGKNSNGVALAIEPFLERNRPESNVDSYSAVRRQQQHAVAQRKFSRVLNSGRIVPQQNVNEACLSLAESRQQCEINILRHARTAPSLQCQAADEAEAPSLLMAQVPERRWLPETDRSFPHASETIAAVRRNPNVGNGLL